jgi:hypothetical protein
LPADAVGITACVEIVTSTTLKCAKLMQILKNVSCSGDLIGRSHPILLEPAIATFIVTAGAGEPHNFQPTGELNDDQSF